jgi:cysteine desulfurase/selenocysteine lyase
MSDAAARKLRRDFPALQRTMRGKPLVYLDNAATTQKPRAVLEAERRFYEEENANVHRAVYELSERATRDYEAARERVARFLNAAEPREIVFTRGTTEAINLVAQSWGRANLNAGDEVLVTEMEHHSNIVPWQLACEQTGARLVVAPISDEGELVRESFEKLVGKRTKLVALAHVSNALGTINPVKELAEIAHGRGALVLVDGAQAAAHRPVDVRALGADFYAFSGHKAYGPMGIGALYAPADLLEALPPWQGGGEMIRSVSFERTTYNDVPYKFEAGTPNVAGAVGLAAALDYVSKAGLQRIERHERELHDRAVAGLSRVPGVRLYGRAREKAGIVSFNVGDVHPHDAGTVLDREGVAVRTGHHCAMPVMARLGVPATCRASFALYNTGEDVDALVRALGKVNELFKVRR